MRDITLDGIRNLMSEDTGEVFALAIKLSHPSWVDDFRAVRDTESLVYDDELYVPFMFDTGLPEQSEGKIPVVSIAVDNIERVLIDEMRTVPSPPSAEMYVFRRSQDGTDTLEIGPMSLKVVRVTYGAQSIELSLSLDADYLNEPASKDRFTPANAPGLFS